MHERSPEPQARAYRRRVNGSLLRIVTVTPAIFLLYAFAPLDRERALAGTLGFIIALLAFGMLAAYQIVAVVRSPYPRIRAVEAALMCVPVLLVMFATAYCTASSVDEGSFTEPLSRLDGFYLAMTVFATVGLGDIAPTSDVTRSMVTVQMAVDLVVVGVLAKVLLRAVERRTRGKNQAAD